MCDLLCICGFPYAPTAMLTRAIQTARLDEGCCQGMFRWIEPHGQAETAREAKPRRQHHIVGYRPSDLSHENGNRLRDALGDLRLGDKLRPGGIQLSEVHDEDPQDASMRLASLPLLHLGCELLPPG